MTQLEQTIIKYWSCKRDQLASVLLDVYILRTLKNNRNVIAFIKNGKERKTKGACAVLYILVNLPGRNQ